MEGFKRYVFNYLSIVALLTILSVVVFGMAIPELYPRLLFIIPLFFVFLICVILLSKHILNRKGKSDSVFYVVFRGIKLVLLLFFVLVCILCIRENLLSFLAVFGVFYLTLLVYECVFFASVTKSKQ
ncbi:MAG: hypothetical protein J5732_08415 [Bacteroidaceae bacterium]|nr:hypothetical protein [Bacteroidaceae bacterium]